LQPYKFVIEYKPGEENAADFMSHHPIQTKHSKDEKLAEDYVNFLTSESLLKAVTFAEVKAATMNSLRLQNTYETKDGSKSETFKITTSTS
jgi:hypothetical protein